MCYSYHISDSSLVLLVADCPSSMVCLCLCRMLPVHSCPMGRKLHLDLLRIKFVLCCVPMLKELTIKISLSVISITFFDSHDKKAPHQ